MSAKIPEPHRLNIVFCISLQKTERYIALAHYLFASSHSPCRARSPFTHSIFSRLSYSCHLGFVGLSASFSHRNPGEERALPCSFSELTGYLRNRPVQLRLCQKGKHTKAPSELRAAPPQLRELSFILSCPLLSTLSTPLLISLFQVKLKARSHFPLLLCYLYVSCLFASISLQ